MCLNERIVTHDSMFIATYGSSSDTCSDMIAVNIVMLLYILAAGINVTNL